MTTKPALFWLDVETSGLIPHECDILEIAWHATTPDLRELSSAETYIIRADDLGSTPDTWNGFVQEMHAKNGLIAAIFEERLGVTKNFVYDRLCVALADLRARGFDIHLAGSSIHFDRGFLAEHFRGSLQHLYYRMVDVSSCKLAALWAGLPEFSKKNPHRALPDVQETIEEFRYLSGLFHGSIVRPRDYLTEDRHTP